VRNISHLTASPEDSLWLYESSFLKYGMQEPTWKIMCQSDETMFRSRLYRLFLKRSMNTKELHRLKNLLEDCCRMEYSFFDGSIKQSIRCKSLDDLELLHRRLIEIQLNVDEEAQTFPLPPIAGNELIQPIVTFYDLKREGLEQQSCISSYGDRISSGHYYVYKMDYPQRVTIGLKIDSVGNVTCDDIRLKHNDEASDEVYSLVESWLYAANKRCFVDELGIDDVEWFSDEILFPSYNY